MPTNVVPTAPLLVPLVQLPGSRHEVDGAVTRLQEIARRLSVDPVAAETEGLGVELMALVDDCLERGRDAVLLTALAALADEREACALLRGQLETASASVLVDRGQGTEVTRLCAIPVLIASEQLPTTGKLRPGAALRDLVASLQDAAFIDSEATVSLADYLYHPQELDRLWPSEVNRLGFGILVRANEALNAEAREAPSNHTQPSANLVPAKGLAASGRSGWPQAQAGDGRAATVQLRYLLAAVTEPLGAVDVLQPRDADENERLQVALADWTEYASSPLAAALGLSADAVAVVSFAPYAEGMRTGFQALRYAQLRTALAPLVDCQAMAQELSVTLAHCDEHGEVCDAGAATALSLVATSSQLAPENGAFLVHRYPVAGCIDAEASLQRVVGVLRDAGVRRVLVAKHRPTAQPEAPAVPNRKLLATWSEALGLAYFLPTTGTPQAA